MMSTLSACDPLIQIISDITRIEPDRFSDESSLFHDFGVAGLDGAEVLEAIGRDFGLDMSEVDWSRYFGPELPYNPIYHLWCVIRGRRLDADIVELRISDLRRSIAEGRWVEPSI